MLVHSIAAIAVLSAAALPTGPGIDLSPDDVTYASSLAAPVISSPLLVPGSASSGVFYLRNASDLPAYLELELANPHWTDAAYAAAIVVTAGVPGVPGRSIRLDSSSACPVFVSGVLLAPDESILVSTTVRLGDLDGRAGQDATASLDLTATLTEAVGGAPGSPCASPKETSGTATPGTRTTTITVLPTKALPAPSSTAHAGAPATVPGDDVRSNTGDGFEGSLIGWASAALLLGAVLFLLLAGRRRRKEEKEAS